MEKDTILNGIKVIDLSRFLAGPYCTMLLADMGAEVIKVEGAGGDETRIIGPAMSKEDPALFSSLNRNKKSICLDVVLPKGLELLYKLVGNADVFIENYVPGTTRELKIDYECLKKINPKLIYCSISAFGNSGPYMNRPGLDIVIQAMSGIMGISGEPNGRPMRPGFPVIDMSTGSMAAYGILLGLFRKIRTNKGMKVDLSLLDQALALQGPVISMYFSSGKNPPRLGNASPFTLATDFKTKDGRYVAISIGHNGFWKRLKKILNSEILNSDHRFTTLADAFGNMKDLIPICEKKFLEKDGAIWEEMLIKGGIPCSLIKQYDEILNDPQVIHNQVIQELEHPVSEKCKAIKTPLTIDGELMIGEKIDAPLLGEHTSTILKELGYLEDDIEKFKKDKVCPQ